MTVAAIKSEVLDLLSSASLEPRGVQREAIERGLLEGASLMVCSPTGSGKTLVGEMAALRAVLSGERALYLVPLRALAAQVSSVMRERYQARGVRVGVTTGDFQTDAEYLADAEIIVTTFERADSLMRRRAPWLDEVGTVVVDEVQTIGERGRGARLESVLMRLRRLLPEVQIVALSATIGAPEELAEWLGCDLIVSEQRPVPLHYSIVPTRDKVQTLRNIVLATVRADGQSIVFARTRRDAESLASHLAPEIGRHMTSAEQREVSSELDSVENWYVSPPRALRGLLHHGVAFHHAGLSYSVRDLIERLFRRGLLRVVFATSTLSAGVDFPARTVIVTDVRSPSDHRTLISANQLHQMLGRAGRPGHDTMGMGIVLVGSKGEAETVRDRYFDVMEDAETGETVLFPRYDRVNSVLSDPEALTEQVLVALATLGESSPQKLVDEYFSDSFLSFCSVRDSRAPARVLPIDAVDARVAMECRAFSDTVRAASEGVLGHATIREKTETTIGGIVRDWDGNQHTCRFSSRTDATGLVEGPMCSCGQPVDRHGILCPHLVCLGITAATELGSLADYVVPLSLDVTSPVQVLVRLGLIEGAEGNALRATRLGRLVCRLYLRISTTREMLALLPLVDNGQDVVSLLRHLVSLEMGARLPDSFESFIAGLASTGIPLSKLAADAEIDEGDALGLVDASRWLLSAMAAVADHGGLDTAREIIQSLLVALDGRSEAFGKTVDGECETDGNTEP